MTLVETVKSTGIGIHCSGSAVLFISVKINLNIQRSCFNCFKGQSLEIWLNKGGSHLVGTCSSPDSKLESGKTI
jgi:hypothetical protein